MEAVDEIEDEHVEYEEVSTDGEVASQGSGDDLLADGDDESVTLVEPSLAVFIIDSFQGAQGEEILTDDYFGEGEAVFIGGHVYKGDFRNGLMHGRGIYEWTDGIKYEGDFNFSTVTGEGVYLWPDGSVYKGGVVRGIRHGYGEFYCSACPSVYSGPWHHGKRLGKGQINFDREGLSYYHGDWDNNRREGQGIRRYLSGNVYEGGWINNKRHGHGTMWWHDRAERYVGEWIQGVQSGRGEHTWFQKRPTGSQYSVRNRYTGDWKDGLRHGYGVFEYASGARYEGQWNKNKKHGKGKFTFQNGVVYEGMFDNDTMLDDMASQVVTDIERPQTPLLSLIGDVRPSSRQGTGKSSEDKTSLVLNVESLLNDMNAMDDELQEVHYTVLRHISSLRDIYAFYSQLGHQESDDNISSLTRMQLWRFLCDCQLHHKHATLAELDVLIGKALELRCNAELHHPDGQLLVRQFVQVLIHLSYFLYSNAIRMSQTGAVLGPCFSQLLENDVLPNACMVKGTLFVGSVEKVHHITQYKGKCWEIFQTLCASVKGNGGMTGTMKMRQFLFMLKDFELIDSNLTAGVAVRAIARDNPLADDGIDCNFDVEIVFLEFFEALAECAVHAIPVRQQSKKPNIGCAALALAKDQAEKEDVHEEDCIQEEDVQQENQQEETQLTNKKGLDDQLVSNRSIGATQKKDQALGSKPSATSLSQVSGKSSAKQERVKSSSPSQHSLSKAGSLHGVQSTSSVVSGIPPVASHGSLAQQIIPEEESGHSRVSEENGDGQNEQESPKSVSSSNLPQSGFDDGNSRESLSGVDWNDEFQVWCWQVDKFFTKRFFPAAEKHVSCSKE